MTGSQHDVNGDFLLQLLDISRQMNENRALDPLLQYTMQRALSLLDAERGYLVLVDDDGNLDFRIKIDRDGNVLQHPEGQISYSILQRVTEKNQPFIINDAVDELKDAESVQTLQLRSVMCAPLAVRDRVIGAIYIDNRSSAGIFEDTTPLVLFANQAAVAIENAKLNDDLEARVAQRTAELERANQQLEASWRAAVEANRIRTMVLGNVAHDMRSPIALAVSALTAMHQGEFGALSHKQQQWVERSLNSMHHAIHLTGDIFDLTKAEMGELEIYKEAVDLEDYLMDVKSIVEGISWPVGVTFKMNILEALPTVMMDTNRIKQVIMNLINNAHKFTQRGSVTLYGRMADADTVLIGVRDTGPGIPPEQTENIFERFHQGDQDNSHRQRGTGLGLAICRELVERHGGRIWVESVYGEGADFQFTLPVK